jgi:hypothetical protein
MLSTIGINRDLRFSRSCHARPDTRDGAQLESPPALPDSVATTLPQSKPQRTKRAKTWTQP